MNSFAVNLKRLRVESGLTQGQLGERLGLSQRRVSYLESGRIEPDLDTIILLAQFFDVSTDSLLGND